MLKIILDVERASWGSMNVYSIFPKELYPTEKSTLVLTRQLHQQEASKILGTVAAIGVAVEAKCKPAGSTQDIVPETTMPHFSLRTITKEV